MNPLLNSPMASAALGALVALGLAWLATRDRRATASGAGAVQMLGLERRITQLEANTVSLREMTALSERLTAIHTDVREIRAALKAAA
jgi:hypothetical protein